MGNGIHIPGPKGTAVAVVQQQEMEARKVNALEEIGRGLAVIATRVGAELPQCEGCMDTYPDNTWHFRECEHGWYCNGCGCEADVCPTPTDSMPKEEGA